MIEAARRQYLTGELTLHTAPTTRVFMRDGTVYYAERSTDGALAIRLMMEGVITREQMQRGTVIVNGVEHVGRMFEVDPTIDRTSVELCVELFTDDVMVDVANRNVNGYEMTLYRRHPSGIDRWYPHAVPVVGRHNESPVAETGTDRAPAPSVAAEPMPVSKPAETSKPTETSKPVEASKPTPEPHIEPTNKLDAPPITLAVPVTRAVGIATPAPPPPNATQRMPVTPLMAAPAPDMASPMVDAARNAPTTQLPEIPLIPPPEPEEVDASTIADEVAEAIKRAFAGMGA
ncbi:MAG: hypothetical protein ACXWBO_13345 [Ilumatobacteraceae bacterium]